MKLALLAVLACLVSPAQTRDPASDPATVTKPASESAIPAKAYRALQEKKYVEAIDEFIAAIRANPQSAALRKDLAYTYLKAGETESAREMFEQALILEPHDWQAMLELAFLSVETGRQARALELLEQVRRAGDGNLGQTANEAFTRVDGELRASIERWSAAVEQDPSNRAARLELALNLEKHREAARAAEQYLAAWKLPPRREETLLDLARARHEAGDEEAATGAWLLASRSADTRIAERARAHLPRRDPFASEYQRALDLDPLNTGLLRDLGYLWLAVNRKSEAVREFEAVVREDPGDLLATAQLGFLYLERGQAARAIPLLEKVAQGADPELARRARQELEKNSPSGNAPARRSKSELARPHKILGEKSLTLSYLNDARREFEIAHEIDPDDREIDLKLGIIYNLLHDDREAVDWFRQALDSPDPGIAAEARRSYSNLAPQFRRVQLSVWTLPLFSSRFHDVFEYAQLKAELRLGRLPLHPYLSLRLVGDWKRKTAEPLPQFLSESSFIGAVGVRSNSWNGFMLWGEAGEAASYLKHPPPGVPRLGPDYRGGVAWSRSFGHSLGAETTGWMAEFNADSVFLSRFQHNVITYWQMRQGYRLPQIGWLRSQVLWNSHVTFDRLQEYYANFVEIGPGLRIRVPGVSPPLDVTISALRGVYRINEFNPRRPNYYDLRVGLWYSASR